LSVYWAIVTLTTVGYGDITPLSSLGRFLSSLLMVTGYAIIAVPTGIVTTEIGRADRNRPDWQRTCGRCGEREHLEAAHYCHRCGEQLPDEQPV
ncbi:MAG: potassium channel family protein, partial [Trueperaceae bacterium]